MNQQSMPQGYEAGAGAYQQPTPYGGIGFGLGSGGGGNDIGAGGHGMGQMSMMGAQMGGMGMGGDGGMIGGGFMGPGGGMGGMGSMGRGMAFGNPQQTSHLMAGMGSSGMGAMGPIGMGGMGTGMGAMGQFGFVETSIEPLGTSYPFTPSTSIEHHLNPVHRDQRILSRHLIQISVRRRVSYLSIPYPCPITESISLTLSVVLYATRRLPYSISSHWASPTCTSPPLYAAQIPAPLAFSISLTIPFAFTSTTT